MGTKIDEADAHELIARGHQALAEILRERGEPVQPTAYTSNRRGPWPPGKTRSWALKNIKNIPGAYKAGRDWCVSVEDFRKWGSSRDVAKVRTAASKTSTAADIAAAALAEAGLRRAG